MEVETDEPKNPPKNDSLFGLGSVFQQRSKLPLESPSGGASSTSSTPIFNQPGPDEPLTTESEQLLDRVPEVIGDGPVNEPSPEPGAGEDHISDVTIQYAIDPDEVEKYLAEGHDWIADFLEMEHWRLSDRQARMLGGPLAQVLQSISHELTDFLPAFLREWIARTPGAAGLLLALGIVEVPKVVVTFKIWQQRARDRREARNSRPVHHAPRPQPQPVGTVGSPKQEPDEERVPRRSSGINYD